MMKIFFCLFLFVCFAAGKSADAQCSVTFASFTATRSGNKVALAWSTASEQNNKGFYVQRNTHGTWANVALVFSATESGNSMEPQQYAFTDLNRAKGVLQYRIQQVGFDGNAQYSTTCGVQKRVGNK